MKPCTTIVVAGTVVLLAGCGSRASYETTTQPATEFASLQRRVSELDRDVMLLRMSLEEAKKNQAPSICVVSTPSGDVVVPCAGTQHISAPPPNTGGGNPAYRQIHY